MDLILLHPSLPFTPLLAAPLHGGERDRVEVGDRAVPPIPPPRPRLLFFLVLRKDRCFGRRPRVHGPGRRRRGAILRCRGGGEGGAAAAELDEQLRCGELGGGEEAAAGGGGAGGGRSRRVEIEGFLHVAPLSGASFQRSFSRAALPLGEAGLYRFASYGAQWLR